MEIFKSNGSFCNFYPNLPKTFFTHKMSKNKVHTWNTVHRKIMVKKNWCMKRELYQLFWNSRISIIKKILEEFNNFRKTAEKIDKKTPKSNKHFSNYLKNQNLNSILLDSVTGDEIESLICNLNSRKAVGPNSIPTHILKEFKNILKIPLAIIINFFFQTGIFSEQCQIVHITPIFKKGDKLDSSNYRPILLLSDISKIFEKAICTRLYKFLDKFECLYKKQFGFKNFHSTNHALVSITEEIRQALDKDKYDCGVFLDFQKAFDTVNQNILIDQNLIIVE